MIDIIDQILAEEDTRMPDTDSYRNMKTNQSLQKWEAQIARIKTQLHTFGRMRPGSLSRQYNVCGKAGCRCKDPKNPQRHGPYHQLNYVYRGKKTSRFIRQECLRQVRVELANYKKFRRLIDQWIGLALQIAETNEKLSF